MSQYAGQGGRVWLRGAPVLVLGVVLVPVLAGLAATILPAFGYLPALGGHEFSLQPWLDLANAPAARQALVLSITVAFGATVLALALALLLTAGAHRTKLFASIQSVLSPLLALPHAAFAIGFAFLISPSGWLLRLVSFFTGWETPPDIALVQDPAGLSLMSALAMKELFFLLLVIFAALGQVRAAPLLAAARTLGYGHFAAWTKVVLPLVYRQIRLPVFAVLVYGLSVADMVLILGPTRPPTFAVLLLQWSQHTDPALRFQSAAGSLLLFFVALGSILLWCLSEVVIARLAGPWATGGRRDLGELMLTISARLILYVTAATVVLVVLALIIWSLADGWPFPRLLPGELTIATWAATAPEFSRPLLASLGIGVVAAALALAGVVGWMENEAWNGRVAPGLQELTYIPLLVPQVSFLIGAQILLVATDLDGTWLAVAWVHVVFVLPYVFLVLADPYRALDPRYGETASALGASPWRVFWQVRLPLLRRPVLVAAAVGFSVSAGQYLATLLPGAGRIATLITEAVVLSSGGDRRVVAVYALAQTLLLLAAFGLALWMSRSDGK